MSRNSPRESAQLPHGEDSARRDSGPEDGTSVVEHRIRPEDKRIPSAEEIRRAEPAHLVREPEDSPARSPED